MTPIQGRMTSAQRSGLTNSQIQIAEARRWAGIDHPVIDISRNCVEQASSSTAIAARSGALGHSRRQMSNASRMVIAAISGCANAFRCIAMKPARIRALTGK